MKKEYSEEYRLIGLRIAYYRKLRHLTQDELAEKIGKSSAYIGSIEAPNINRSPSLDTLYDISFVLDVPIYKFFISDLTEE